MSHHDSGSSAIGMLIYDESKGIPLPPWDTAPRLSPFPKPKSPIEVLELLSPPQMLSESVPQYRRDSDDCPYSGGIHAHVFKVSIGGKFFALKVFKFQSIDALREKWYPDHNHEVDNKTFTYQCDPFFAECRAYARIQEYYDKKSPKSQNAAHKGTGRRGRGTVKQSRIANPMRVGKNNERKLAVPCFGYIHLPADPYEDIFAQRFSITKWNRLSLDKDAKLRDRRPFRALLKEFADKTAPAIVNPRRMLSNLKILRNIGVYQRDVAARNYMNGLLIDFDLAATVPFWAKDYLEKNTDHQYKIWINKDLYSFDDMIEDSGMKTNVRACPNESLLYRLRNQRTPLLE